MIPVKNIHKALEKNSSVSGEILKNTLKFIKHHPWITLGTVGGVVGSLSLAKNVVPAYHIINEENKRGIMKDQTNTLHNIERYIAKSQQSQKQDPRFIPLVQPLA